MCEVCTWLRRGPHVELLDVVVAVRPTHYEVNAHWLVMPRGALPAATRTEQTCELMTTSLRKASRHHAMLRRAIGITGPLR